MAFVFVPDKVGVFAVEADLSDLLLRGPDTGSLEATDNFPAAAIPEHLNLLSGDAAIAGRAAFIFADHDLASVRWAWVELLWLRDARCTWVALDWRTWDALDWRTWVILDWWTWVVLDWRTWVLLDWLARVAWIDESLWGSARVTKHVGLAVPSVVL